MGNVLLFQSKPFPLSADALTEFAEQHRNFLSGNSVQASI
jgi:hypothetical protein